LIETCAILSTIVLANVNSNKQDLNQVTYKSLFKYTINLIFFTEREVRDH